MAYGIFHYLRTKMTYIQYIIVILGLPLSHSEDCSSRWSYLTLDRRHKLDNHLVRKATNVMSETECLSVCLRFDSCQSINFAASLKECHVNDDTKDGSPSNYVEDEHFDYYGPRDSPHYLDTRNFGCPDACFNGGICTEYCHPPWFQCDCAPGFRGEQCTLSDVYPTIATSCKDYSDNGHTITGVLQVDPDGAGPFDIYCDMDTDGGGWSTFQRRFDGSVDFYKTWANYVNGFGSLSGEHWLGLDNLYRLASGTRTLRIDLTDWDDNHYYATYSTFYVHGSSDQYRGYFGGYSGTLGDSLGPHNGQRFSTYDADHDSWNSNCAAKFLGAWWHNACHQSNLNGYYYIGGYGGNADGMTWLTTHGHGYSMKMSEMKLRN